MLITLLVAFIAFIIVVSLLEHHDKIDYDSYECLVALSTICSVIVFIAIIIASIFVVKGRTIDSKIELYQEQNAAIESNISEVVSSYMAYESGTFEKLSSESVITLISLYPELKADTLVSQQCNLYIENNDKISTLKERKIDNSTYKWLLYFGG